MKRLLALAMNLFVICSIAFSQQNPGLIGTWKLVSGKSTHNDSTSNYEAANTNAIKIVTPTHFAVLSQGTDNRFGNAVAGKVKLEGDRYIESVAYCNVPSIIGKDMAFTYELTGDRWHIRGGGNGYVFDEYWERVK
ncbi:MAG: hypothetical protein V4717_20640 [Bacteroidota bacterium]